MSITFENFNIDKIIAHEVYQKEIDGVIPPYLSDNLLALDYIAKSELSTRIISAIGQNGDSLEMDIIQTDENSVFYLSKNIINDSDDNKFITTSKLITEKLSNTQTRRNIPGGVVVIFSGTIGIDDKKCCGIIKAEKHNGFRLIDVDNQKKIEYISNLLLTPEQKLYKIGMFIKDGINDEDIRCFIFDSNNRTNKIKSTADYFRKDFMGCDFQNTSDITTRNFFIATKEFIIKESTFKGQEMTDMMTALYTYIKSDTSNIISVSDFNSHYINDPAEKDRYIRFMNEKNIPSISIHKDLSKLDNILKRRRIRFDNDISLVIPAEDFSKNLEIIESNDEYTTIRIKGNIKSEI